MLPNDDLDLQVVFLERIRRCGLPINRHILASAWLENIHFWPDEYGVAYRNLVHGLYPPLSGAFDNKFACGMGAAIRSEIWACLAPGSPEVAVALAREDASVDHAGDGLYASVFLTSLQSMAFVESDTELLLDRALSFIPSDCRVASAIMDTRKWWSSLRDWQQVRQMIVEKHAVQNFTDVAANLAFIVLGWLNGGGDFGSSICTAVNCGFDADCTCATLGALLGILDPDSIGEEWVKPIGRDLVLSSGIVGMHHPATLDEFCEQVISLALEVVDYYDCPMTISDAPGQLETASSQNRPYQAFASEVVQRSDFNPLESLVCVEPLRVSVEYPREVAFAPGVPSAVSVAIFNPCDRFVGGELEFRVPDGWSVNPRRLNLYLEPRGSQTCRLSITAPGAGAIRVYRNTLDMRFDVDGLSWCVSAGLVQTIPWLRARLDSDLALDPDFHHDGNVCPAEAFYRIDPADVKRPGRWMERVDEIETVEAFGHTQVVPPGRHIFATDINLPRWGIYHFIAQGTRLVDLWLHDRLICSHSADSYIPTFHRSGNGVDVDSRPGWSRVTIVVGDGDTEGELFFGVGERRSWLWTTDLEWRRPVLCG
jgi:ADP-ribosylglycohydrolase